MRSADAALTPPAQALSKPMHAILTRMNTADEFEIVNFPEDVRRGTGLLARAARRSPSRQCRSM